MASPRPPSHIGRKRRAVGWTLLTLGVIVAAVWVVSGWWRYRLIPDRSSFLEIQQGHIMYQRFTGLFVPMEGWWLDPVNPSGWRWFTPIGEYDNWDIMVNIGVFTWANYSIPPAVGRRVDVALWPFAILLITPAARLLRSGTLARRRAMTNACVKCGYSLAGLAETTACPECGKAKSPSPQLNAD